MQKEINWIIREKYKGKLTNAAKKDIQRLKGGEPVDYIIGFKEFLGCKIDLSKKPLIPRPETEFWVEKAIKQIYHNSYDRKSYGMSVLDIFAGSGCIGIALLKNLPKARVVFADNGKNFLGQIKINCKINNIKPARYKIVKSDVFIGINPSSLKPRRVKFDLVFANPPYIPISRKHKVKKSVLKYEPREALFGGKDGMRYIRKFLALAKNFLKPGGRIFMEFDSMSSTKFKLSQKKEIENILKRYGYKRFEFNKDQYGKWRWVSV